MKYWATFLNIALFFCSAIAQISPGDLHKSHAHLEGVENCTKCHELGKQIDMKKCLDCHVILNQRIKSNQGLHSNKEYKRCVKCHVEHQGRDYELIYWEKGKDNFNHDLTGYKLEGKHQEQKCENCHNPKNIIDKELFKKQKKNLKTTFLGLNQSCITCHDDEHRGQLSNSCLNCHDYAEWKAAKKFNHDDAKFKLTGKHKTVECEKCHRKIVDNKFADNPDYLKMKNLKYGSCSDCHQDVHKGRFRQKCEECHNTFGWKNYSQKKFNHDQTKYPLRGKHAVLRCEQCHLPGKPLKIAKFDRCLDCHEDYHQGQFKNRTQKGNCEECHVVDGFVPSLFTLSKHEKTDYPLRGSHLAVPCIGCHKKINLFTPKETIKFSFTSTKCQQCHENPHGEQVKDYLPAKGCEYCHSEEAWSFSTFDHNSTKFPLEGRHAQIECKKCHKPLNPERIAASYQFKGVIKLCQNCHEDIHLGQFRDEKIFAKTGKNFTRCERCHAPIDWLAERFDHNRDAKFKLDGGHENVACNQCHKQEVVNGKKIVRYKPLDTACKSCHQN